MKDNTNNTENKAEIERIARLMQEHGGGDIEDHYAEAERLVDETAEREAAKEARREWRKQRKEYAIFRSKKEVGDLSAVDEYAREFDQLHGRGPSPPRDSASRASTGAHVQGEGQWDALSLDFLHTLVGGDCDGLQILAPGPGHNNWDRSMCVQPSTHVIDGFVVHSFSPRTDDMECKKYINFLYEYWIYEHLEDASPLDSPVTPHTPQSWIEAAQCIGAHSQSQSPARTSMDDEQKIESARMQFNKMSSSNLGESVFAYFRSRGLELPDNLIGRVVRYQREGRWYEATGDQVDKNGLRYSISEVMLFACVDVLSVNNKGRAIQVVRLPHIGKGPERKVKGVVGNAAIKLTPHEEVLAAGEVAIAEGFESALAAMALGYQNVWACVNSDNIKKFPVIEGINKLTILAENCPANEESRELCAFRWHEAGREVIIAMPEHGKDFNDDLVELTLRKAGVA